MELGLYIKEQNKTDLKTEFKKSRFNSFEDYLIHEVRELRKQVKKSNIDDVSEKPEIQICYKDNKICKYDCEGLCKESC